MKYLKILTFIHHFEGCAQNTVLVNRQDGSTLALMKQPVHFIKLRKLVSLFPFTKNMVKVNSSQIVEIKVYYNCPELKISKRKRHKIYQLRCYTFNVSLAAKIQNKLLDLSEASLCSFVTNSSFEMLIYMRLNFFLLSKIETMQQK